MRRKILFDEERHAYTVDGKQVPSVTTILAYVTARHYGDINKEVLRLAAERGTEVHKATETIDYGGEPEVYPEIVPYVNAYIDFLRDFAPEILYAERMVYGEAGYCGTIDRVARVLGKTAVIDLKTTASPTRANYISYCAQTLAYADALREEDGVQGEIRRFLLFLKKDGKYRLVDCEKYEEKHKINARRVWDLCLELYKTIEGENE